MVYLFRRVGGFKSILIKDGHVCSILNWCYIGDEAFVGCWANPGSNEASENIE